ncbi:regulator of telomere elongation helicase 1 homolog [Nephila pilipes]|uniref:Regulator of telomere elongation helicase 1 homolog n=1 Tax=Nephila pilipes TaxID=299642 RepID=A0A8X6UM33_NEPPI|nr:regulator of telomere elongation helicase 1 homolog [Nephila pilipes]
MAQCNINGVQILFPFQPYPVQEEYMKKVIECLKKKVNGILESPTGTGKTLSLLCSSLAWLESYKAQQQLNIIQHSSNEGAGILNDIKSVLSGLVGSWDSDSNFMVPRIIYSSRTHSQLSQAIQELKRSNYKHVKSVVLGSRDQLCLHPEVSKAPNHTAKVYMCRAKISSKTCPFYMNYEEKILSKAEYQDSSVLDIEDLVTLGKKNMVCPYYATRYLNSRADMIFTPYNYIIDPKSRRAHGIELQGNILIFDEAHNIEGALEESMSFQLRSYDLALCITEVTQTMEMIKDFDEKFSSSDTGAPDFTLTDLSILKVMFCELEDVMDKEAAEISNNDGSKPGDYMIEILSKVELTAQKKEVVLDLLDKVILYHSAKSDNPWTSKGTGLQKFSDLISVLFSRTSSGGYREHNFKKEFSAKYRIFLQYETTNKSQTTIDPWAIPAARSKKKPSWKLDCWCFSPELGMRDIVDRGVHSIILTSGTLSPLGPMINELGVSFPVQLENPHIIKDNQIFVGVVTCGPDGTPLNSSYQNRSNERYISSLGRTMCNFCRMIPDGLLVFFPSYSVMKSNVGFWEENGIWQSLSGLKPLFMEPQGKDAFQESIEKYYSVIKDPTSKGATLLAVCRGKVSEGLDFADENARAVIITGLPFPPSMDPRVKMKMNYLNNIAKEKKGLYGNDWYVLQASRAVNQAIGRVIRHKDDFGAILLCDNRFKDKRIQSQLSKWIQGRINVFDSFGPALKNLSSFFKSLDQLPRRTKQDSALGGFQIGSRVFNAESTQEAQGNTSVPGIRTGSSEVSENIFDSYKHLNTVGVSTSNMNKSSSIFDALDDQSQPSAAQASKPISLAKYNSSYFVNNDCDSHVPSTSEKANDSKRRKISVQLRQAVQPDDKKSVTEMWKSYLLEVKTLLGLTEQYGKFCSSVKDFKTSKNVENFAISLKSVFSAVPNKSKYLQTASLLVGVQDRDKFLALSI